MGVDAAIDITTEDRKTVLELLRRYLPATAAWAYGSRVKWTSRPQSDLDIVVFATPEQRRQVGDLREALEESNLQFRVDLFVWDDVPNSFRKPIQDEHVVLLDARPQDVPDQWGCRRLEDCTESIIDYRGKTPRKTSSGIPLITARVVKRGRIETPTEFIAPSHYTSWMRRGLPQAGDVLITTEAPLGEVAQLQEPSVALAQRLILLRGKSGVLDNRFLRFLLQSDEVQVQLRARATGTTVLGIKQKELRQIELSLPPIHEQRAIAYVLGTFDDKIELNLRMNATLEATARALFRSWFVDFDPVRAKMEGCDTGLPKEIADLFPDRLVNSEVGEIPEGWPLVPLPELIDVNPSRPLRKGDVVPYLDMANMPTRGHAPDSVVRRPFGSGTRFANGDTLVARITPCLENGKTAYVDFLRDDEIGWGSTEYIVMKPRRSLPSEFAYLLARTARFREFAIQNMSGTRAC